MREDWIEVKLGEICEVNMGQSPPSSTYNNEGNGLPFFQGKAEFTELYPVVEKWCDTPKKIANPFDILLSVRAPVGATNMANVTCGIGRGLAAITYRPECKYIWYFLKYIEKRLDDQGTGTTFKAVSGGIIRSQIVPLPPLLEQRAIIAKIEELFSELDNGVANLNKAKEKIEIYRQAVLKKAFEGELTKEWRNRNLVDRTEWIMKSLGAVLKTIDGDRGKNYPSKSELISEGYCLFLSTKNVRKGNFVFNENIFITKEKDEILRGGKLLRNDVVITTRGTLGNVALYDNNVKYECVRINSGMLILRINDLNELMPQFLMRYINSSLFFQQLKSKQSGTAQPQIPANVLREIEIEIPKNIEEQKQIVDEVENRLLLCDEIIYEINESLIKADLMRQSILKKAFEGDLLSELEIESCKNRSEWESAVKLFEKIKSKSRF
jgi:type I restriction enzyme S subunit